MISNRKLFYPIFCKQMLFLAFKNSPTPAMEMKYFTVDKAQAIHISNILVFG